MTSDKLLRPSLIRLVLATVVVLLASTGAQGQNPRNFWLLNNTGKVISEVYVSPHESGYWGSDVLGEAQLVNGVGTLIVFPPGSTASCSMDFKLVFADGIQQTYLQGRDVCQLGAVQFNRRDSIGLPMPF